MVENTAIAPRTKTRHRPSTRTQILNHAVDIASEQGLEGLTIGRLAKTLGMSKSGLFAHFGSKEDLQLATVKAARDVFITEVVEPSENAENGLKKLDMMVACWLSYVARNVFRGGCFFSAASAEFDGRPGPVRNLIAALTKAWVDSMTAEARTALENGEIAEDEDPDQLVFELHALVQEANWAYQLHNQVNAFDRARRGIEQRLKNIATVETKTSIVQEDNQ